MSSANLVEKRSGPSKQLAREFKDLYLSNKEILDTLNLAEYGTEWTLRFSEEDDDKFNKIDCYYSPINHLDIEIGAQLRAFEVDYAYMDTEFAPGVTKELIEDVGSFPLRISKLKYLNELERVYTGLMDNTIFLFGIHKQGKFEKRWVCSGRSLREGVLSNKILATKTFREDGNQMQFVTCNKIIRLPTL